MWQQGEGGRMTWEAALTHCENLDLADHNDWRLPNRNELQSLSDYQGFRPAIDSTAFPGVVLDLADCSKLNLGLCPSDPKRFGPVRRD